MMARLSFVGHVRAPGRVDWRNVGGLLVRVVPAAAGAAFLLAFWTWAAWGWLVG